MGPKAFLTDYFRDARWTMLVPFNKYLHVLNQHSILF